MGYDAPVLGGDSYDDPAMIQSLGPLGNDIYFVTHTFMSPDAHPEMEQFIGLFEDMFDEPPDTSSWPPAGTR